MSEDASRASIAQWVLRVGVSAEFAGHGVVALQGSPSFAAILEGLFGVDFELALSLLAFIGWGDLVVALIVLVRPIRVVLLWATAWGFLTALARPLTGSSWWGFVERGANWAAPLALLLLRGWPRTLRDWCR